MLNKTLKVFKKKTPPTIEERILNTYKEKPSALLSYKNPQETLTIFSNGVFDINGKRVYISDGKIIYTEDYTEELDNMKFIE